MNALDGGLEQTRTHIAPRALARLAARIDLAARGWRGPLLAALVVLAAGLPGLFAMPPLDRDESRFAQATAQMLETGDLVNIRFQAEPRDKKPVGIHWLQAASVSLASSVEKREIWAYRLPSLLGAMLAAAACAWGARAGLGGRGGLIAGVTLGASFLLSSEAFIAKTDAVLCGATTLSMAALGRIYLAERQGPPAPKAAPALFWIGQALAILVKGPITPMIAALTLLTLWAVERRADWMRRLGWVWGLVLVLAVVGPWAVAITVATDGAFWGRAVGGDLAPKLAGAHESHGAPFGLHLALSPILMFPTAALLPAAAVAAWKRRREPFTRFALAWLVPAWLVFEAMPTKLVHYPLPLYGALAWLAAQAFDAASVWPARWIGAVLSIVSGAALAGVCLWAAAEYGAGDAHVLAVVCAVFLAGAGLAGAVGLLKRAAGVGFATAIGLGVIGHALMTGALAPRLGALFPSAKAAAALSAAGINPRDGLTKGPVAVAGYAEPSLVFALGTATELGGPEVALAALADGRPALVEGRQEAALTRRLAANRQHARQIGQVEGLDYSNGKPVRLSLWRSEPVSAAVESAD